MDVDVVVVGHMTVDVNVLPHGIIENVLGGAPTYSGFAMTALGSDVGIVSKIGQDFPEQFPPLFGKFGLDTEGLLITRGKTTKFENKYTEEGGREQICKGVADSISSGDIPRSYLDAQGFYISPVADEISPETLAKFSEGEGVVMLDPQGIFREVDEDGRIDLKKPESLQDYLAYSDIVKIGKDELRAFEGSEEEVLESLVSMGPEIAILTLGEKGCKVLFDGEVSHIENIEATAEDLTGAGDVFGAAFLHKYLESKNPVQSARFANAAAGLKIEYKGPTGFPTEEEVSEAVKKEYS